MFRKVYLLSLVLLVALAGVASAEVVNAYKEWNSEIQLNTIGGLQVTSTGHAKFTARVNQDAVDVTIEAGGLLETQDTYKLPDDNPAPILSNVYVNGTWNANNIESKGTARAACIYVGANGVINIQIGYGGTAPYENPVDYDPLTWLADNSLLLDPALDPAAYSIQIEDLGGGACRITAEPLGVIVAFDLADSSNTEAVSPAEITVSLISADPGQSYSVDYAVTGGTATDGADYTLPGACECDFDGSGSVDFRDVATMADNWLSDTPGNVADVTGDSDVTFTDFGVCALEWRAICGGNTLQFNPGETVKTISINIIDDGLSEGNETIELTLSNATGPDALLGSRAQHTYTIVETKPTVAFDSSSGSGKEDVTNVAIGVTLSTVWSETVTVSYAPGSGTATGGGTDYTLNPGTLTFSPGQMTATINVGIVDDEEFEDNETVSIRLFNPTNATLGANSNHTYTIIDNEAGVMWDGLRWFYSEYNASPLRVNSEGNLEWNPTKGHQFITRIPEHRLSQSGDVVEISYMWMTDGDHDCRDCFSCDLYCFDDDITCIAGTSDIRVGLFEADGQYVDRDGLGISNSIFDGYKGYNFRFGPNMKEGPNRWVDCRDEVHKTGQFCKKPEGSDSLMRANEGEIDYIDGFELTPGQYSFFKVRLERTSSSRVKLSITLNGRTQNETDSGGDQPQKIDVLAVYMRNGRPYNRLVLAKP